jgi:ADP-ribose pyrophosphatase
MSFHDFIRDSDGWRTLREEVKFANSYMSVIATEIKTPTRDVPCSWTVVHRKAAVVVIPVTQTGSFVLVRQERIPIRATIWEFPAGQIDDQAEREMSIRETALRELREEAGYQLAPDGKLISLGYFFPSAGFTDEHSHLVLARPVIRHSEGHEPDEHEAIVEWREFSREDLREAIASGEIRDANTLSAYARMCAMSLI